MNTDLHLLKASDFQPYLNQTIAIRFSKDVKLTATLTEVNELKNYSELERNPFCFVLQTKQKENYYQQSIYIIEHPVKGDLPVFLVPLGIEGEGMRYEAVFS